METKSTQYRFSGCVGRHEDTKADSFIAENCQSGRGSEWVEEGQPEPVTFEPRRE